MDDSSLNISQFVFNWPFLQQSLLEIPTTTPLTPEQSTIMTTTIPSSAEIPSSEQTTTISFSETTPMSPTTSPISPVYEVSDDETVNQATTHSSPFVTENTEPDTARTTGKEWTEQVGASWWVWCSIGYVAGMLTWVVIWVLVIMSSWKQILAM
ncbi:uncharacterized protein LOC110849380 [Folsomia candida]|nr:uncharacterized protein LOC110849380 [Folsomia candida]